MTRRWQFWVPVAVVLVGLAVAMWTVPESWYRPLFLSFPVAVLVAIVVGWAMGRSERRSVR